MIMVNHPLNNYKQERKRFHKWHEGWVDPQEQPNKVKATVQYFYNILCQFSNYIFIS